MEKLRRLNNVLQKSGSGSSNKMALTTGISRQGLYKPQESVVKAKITLGSSLMLKYKILEAWVSILPNS